MSEEKIPPSVSLTRLWIKGVMMSLDELMPFID
jgi:hypothetical protein